MIVVINGYLYDTDKPFEEQDKSTIQFITEWIANNVPTFNFDESNRPFEYVYSVDRETEIVKKQNFTENAPSCAIDGETIFVRGVEIWHEPNYSIQIILTLEQQVNLLRAYPDFALYTSQSNLPTYVEGNKLYTYDNTLCAEYRMLVMYFGGIINDKNNIKI